MQKRLKSAYPYFGGKSEIASEVWDRFGDVPNFVDPFFGSNAILLARPHEPRCETVNEIDPYIANFWRCLSEIRDNPEKEVWREVAKWADWPVNEGDLHPRHLWLVKQAEFRKRMAADPMFYDPKIAGWWVWGIGQWIGGGWCKVQDNGRTLQRKPLMKGSTGVHSQTVQAMPKLGRHKDAISVPQQMPRIDGGGNFAQHRKRPNLGRGGKGVNRVTIQKPALSTPGGRGVHSFEALQTETGLLNFMGALAERMRRVRVVVGDFERILGHSPTTAIGMTAVFLDPPYGEAADRDVRLYANDDLQVAERARQWAIANGDNPLLRIALCGYHGEHDMPANWECLQWKARGGYASSRKGAGKDNCRRERIWFSPHCLKGKQQDLFL